MPSKLKLSEVKLVIETLVNIQWESSPGVDSRGGITMTFLVPENINFDMLVKGLDNAGYQVVI
jgi:hypothetical protein